MVLLKDYNDLGFVIFTKYESRKGFQFSSNSRATLLFYRMECARQIRKKKYFLSDFFIRFDFFFRKESNDEPFIAIYYYSVLFFYPDVDFPYSFTART
jgi:hypothetical protein